MGLFRRITAVSIVLVMLLSWSPATAAPDPATPIDPTRDPAPAATLATGAIRIQEIVFRPASGGSEWVELQNVGSAPLDIRGYTLTDEDGHGYRIPHALPDVPPGAFVVVMVDGLGSGSDDYDLGDGVATLHTAAGMVDVFEDDADQCALYVKTLLPTSAIHLPLVGRNFGASNPPVPEPPGPFPELDLVSYVAWGAAPGEDASAAEAAGLWHREWYVSLYRGLGEASDESAALAGESIGLLPRSEDGFPNNWTLYRAPQVSRGQANPVPTISWYCPAAGATLGSETFSIGWDLVEGATGYRFQLDDDAAFGSPSVSVSLAEPRYAAPEAVPDGRYYWRVKVQHDGGESPWSPAVEINSVTVPIPTAGGPQLDDLAYKELHIGWQLQHKDTRMLCLDRDPETGANAWNTPHTTRGQHGRQYCVRASVAMLASYYGGHLSQDRITYETLGAGTPEGDLGHNVPFSGTQARASLSWALGQNVAPAFGKPTFAAIKGWIDADRPMRSVVPGHSRAIDGYCEFTVLGVTVQMLHILNPWDQAVWVDYDSDDMIYVQVCPAGPTGAPGVRSDEDVDGDGIADTMDDSDGDGVCDFDERVRFRTSPTDPDSDHDLVPELQDIREYIYDASGALKPTQLPDRDGDGKRKELDPDSDYGDDKGQIDGCEDADHDGRYEPALGETSNFDPTDDMSLHVQLRWPLVDSDVDIHLIKPGGTFGGPGDAHWENPNPDWGMTGVECDDPRLDIDCIVGCTVENIRLARLENGIYTVVVHYFSDHNLGPTSPRVTLWVQQTRYDVGPAELFDDYRWTVATVEWPSKVVTLGGPALQGPPRGQKRDRK